MGKDWMESWACCLERVWEGCLEEIGILEGMETGWICDVCKRMGCLMPLHPLIRNTNWD